MKEKIGNLDNWTSSGWDGVFRFVIAAKAAYEIVTLFHYTDTPILTAKANLYVTGLWHKDGQSFLERELLGLELPIQELLKIAQNDLEKWENS